MLNKIYNKSKIVATLGPSSWNTIEDKIKLINNGVSMFRLNMSHVDFDILKDVLKRINEINNKLEFPIGILLDTKGPEIRLGMIENDMIKIKKNDKITFSNNMNLLGTKKEIPISYDNFSKIIKIGDKIFVDDAKLTLQVVEISDDKVTAIANNDYILKSRKGVNVPGIKLDLPFISNDDKEAIKFGLENNIKSIAASFVNSKNDVIELRQFCKKLGYEKVQIISKIESLLSINNIDEIINVSDAIMLARGDLGIEIPFEYVPKYQMEIIKKCRILGKPIIIATQMLESMSDNSRATRAEVNDVFIAIMQLADCTMLSGETAGGKFPFESVKTMKTIQIQAEKEFDFNQLNSQYKNTNITDWDEFIINGIKQIDDNNSIIISLEDDPKFVRRISQFRPNSNIIVLTNDDDMSKWFGIDYGVWAKKVNINFIEFIQNYEYFKTFDKKIVISKKALKIL